VKLKFWSVVVSRLPANAMALYPFMLFKSKSLKSDDLIINHEKIHFKQQQELLILPFYILYLLQYLVNRLKYKNHQQAYLNICFEQEAYTNDRNMDYLHGRKPYAWIHFLKGRPIGSRLDNKSNGKLDQFRK
jgi:hypothetical protein